MRCFRMNSADQDPRRLLTDKGQWTEPWGSSEENSHCDKCDGSGITRYSCWSCLLTGADQACPVCEGRVRFEARCPVCRGSGEVDGKPRHGVSVFPTIEGLYHYLDRTEADLDGCVIVELEADLSSDVDFDADQGAMLVIPTAIHDCEPAERGLLERVREQSARVEQG